MSQFIVIQYGRLENLVTDVQHGQIIRVTTLEMTEGEFNIPGLRVAAIGVHVRTINHSGHILACYLPVAKVQVYDRSSPDSEDRQQVKAAWEKAEALQQRVIVYLQAEAAHRDFEIRTDGIIHLDGVGRPMRGEWKGDPGAEKREE
jgi:hypothetical protein